MGFREQVAADIKGVFINSLEFADAHNLNGTECECVIYGDTTDARSTVRKTANLIDGIHGDFITVCVKADELEEVPKQGNNFKVDGALYKVDSCTEDMGMLTIELGAYRMRGPLG